MKYTFIILFIGISIILSAQGVGIGTQNPDNSALLELDVSGIMPKKGLLLPKVNLLNKTDQVTIVNPAKGLLAYNLANTESDETAVSANRIYYWDGVRWVTPLKTEEIPESLIIQNEILSSYDNQLFSIDQVDALNNNDSVVVEWDDDDEIQIDTENLEFIQADNQIKVLKTGYYQISGTFNFLPDIIDPVTNVAGVIATIQASTDDGLNWVKDFGIALPYENQAANQSQTVVFPVFIHNYAANTLLRLVLTKPSYSSDLTSGSGIIPLDTGDITKSIRVYRIN